MKRLIATITTVFCLLAPGVAAAAYNPLGLACGSGSGAASSSSCSANGSDPITGKNGVLMKASMVIASIAGVTAVIIILYSAFRYITSAGDAQKAANARSALIGSAVGLVIIMAAEGIVIFVVRNL